ncbi:hypothetical protein [Desertivibrio insolitus]|uniref:hypothetical protein n=1 Tax=Herbiconiux sp. SYSU D00978 TaxID=2812562 RepID=UPI001A97C9C8|nr:hypothetical protein [Herbiconiux sp. SYSU D00978]
MGEQLAESPSTVALPSAFSTLLSAPDAWDSRLRGGALPRSARDIFSAATDVDDAQAVDLVKGVRARPRAGDLAAATDRKEVA